MPCPRFNQPGTREAMFDNHDANDGFEPFGNPEFWPLMSQKSARVLQTLQDVHDTIWARSTQETGAQEMKDRDQIMLLVTVGVHVCIRLQYSLDELENLEAIDEVLTSYIDMDFTIEELAPAVLDEALRVYPQVRDAMIYYQSRHEAILARTERKRMQLLQEQREAADEHSESTQESSGDGRAPQ